MAYERASEQLDTRGRIAILPELWREDGGDTVECTKVNCPMQAGTPTDNCGENCPWRTTAKTGDLISRAAAIKCAIDAVDDWDGGWNPNRETVIRKYFEELPAVDAAPVVHGRWVDEEGNPVPWCDALPSTPAYSCWCNQCGAWLVASDEYPVYGLFCPACGAKMDGERNCNA